MQQDAESGVAAYLRANPGFLATHPVLYEVLQPPRRVHGVAAADHMAAMVSAARERVVAAERAAEAAAADRRAVEGFLRRVQDAVLVLMRVRQPAMVVAHELAGLLHVDSARLCGERADVFPEGVGEGVAEVPRGTVVAVLGQRLALVRTARPDVLLHGEAVALACQEALVRVPLARSPALLALACRDGSGLQGATTDTLAFLGHAIGAAMERA